MLPIFDGVSMAARLRDPLDDLEKYRVQLEENVTKLRTALKHWQTWEAEYEAFKEEIIELPEDVDDEALVLFFVPIVAGKMLIRSTTGGGWKKRRG